MAKNLDAVIVPLLTLITGLSLLFIIISTTTSYWETVKPGTFVRNEVHFGLFRKCEKPPPLPRMESCTKDDIWTQPDWMNTVQAFMTLAVTCNSLVLAGILVALFREQKQNVKLIAFGLFLTSLFCLFAVCIFTPNSRVSLEIKVRVHKGPERPGSKYYPTDTTTLNYGSSYIVAWFGVFTSLVGCVLGSVQVIKERINNSKSNQTVCMNDIESRTQHSNGGVQD